ncbi:MAG: sugar phosphate isomerase/epimerase family protein [Saprospiraceae bacterium]
MEDLSKLCIHTITTKPWSIEESAKKFSAQGVKGITVWRDALAGRDIKQTGQMLRDHQLEIVSLCRGGFFPSVDSTKRKLAIDDNRKAIEEAHKLGTSLIVLVCGADPGQPLEESRKQIQDGIEAVIPDASAAGVRLAIEPLHPVYADTRSAINTMTQANDMVESIQSPWIGVAIDVYHLWWDPSLEKEIIRCGTNNSIFAFHVCDWKSPTLDVLNDRGLMGEGCIPIKKIRSWVEEAGFSGFNEVEIFSTEYWKQDQDAFLQKIISSYTLHV